MPSAAESTLRLLYMEHIGEDEQVSTLLKRIADLEAKMYKELHMRKDGEWRCEAA
jgi:hypothetical protein